MKGVLLLKDKEKAVYEAVGRLVLSGHTSSQLTVSAIAREAGVGKGTVYEYFTTKEELIAKAMSYNLGTQAEVLLGELKCTPEFEEKVVLILDRIDVMSEVHRLVSDAFSVLAQHPGTPEQGGCLKELVFPVLQRILDNLTEAAVRSGMLAPDAPRMPIEYAFINVLAGYCFISHMPQIVPDTDTLERRRLTVQMMRTVLAL